MNSKEILEIAVKAADSKRAEDIVALDVEKVSLLADYFLIMHASNERQVMSIVDEIVDQEEQAGVKVNQVEGKQTKSWVLVDLGEVVVHVFQKEQRDFYNLEKLWRDAPMVNIDAWMTED